MVESLKWKPKLLQIPLNLSHKGGHIFPENVSSFKILINRFQPTKSMDLRLTLPRLQDYENLLQN
jgi:hypothetical protein